MSRIFSISKPDTARSRRHPLLRIRYQLAGGLLLAIGAPLLARMMLEPRVLFSINIQVTITGVIIAHILGYMIYRRLGSFPGVANFSTILPAFLLGYGLVFVAIFFLRLDYSRFQAATSFLLSILWYFSLGMIVVRQEVNRLALVPFGAIDRLEKVDNAVWHMLQTPELDSASSSTNSASVQGVVADLRADLPENWQRFITGCVLSGVPVYHVKQILESLTGRVEIEHLSENTLGSLNPNQTYIKVKQAADWLAALIALIALAPLLLLVALLVRLETAGPALFRQERVGYRGRVFTVYKFRTMHHETHSQHASRETAMTQKGDPRITRIGRVLRRSRLDELPQLINILRGEMSWIGPRPEAMALSRWYENELAFYAYRHIVRPGITGWAQVNQGHVTAVDDVHEKLHYDFYYIKNFSPWLDLVIVMRTMCIMLTGFGAR
ncbi:exopolysaccharide biosynthesis polyprenyl glycosylphosphotransferase [Aquamicrobium segne]|uniref:Exopolysaccharide biosynthesis polyprenyl glycosylphosphotransferase n=1 Tax=Aquamicrobium segne TaxID=469547 RepID=A0ABW0GUU5_9HYPH